MKIFNKLCAVGVGIVLLAGCSNPLDRIVEGAVQGVADSAIEELTDGELSGVFSAEIPDDFPDIPLPNFDPVHTMRLANEDGTTWTLIYASEDESTYEEITAALVQRGFVEEMKNDMGGIHTSMYSNAEYIVMVNSSIEDDAAALQIIVSEKDE